MGFGGLEPLLRDYNETKFIQAYVELIKEVQNMPTKPIIFIALPTYGCEQNYMSMRFMADKGGFDHWIRPEKSLCAGDHAKKPTETIYKMAQQAGIPNSRILNSWDLLRPGPPGEPVFADVTHPTDRGHQILGNQAYKILSEDA